METRKVALITGASGGIGAACCIKLAASGMDIVVNFRGDKELAQEVVQQCEAKGVKAIAIQGDISNAIDVEKMFEKIMDVFGRIDVLVNNAGITKDNLVLRMSEADFDDVININLKGAFLCSQKAAKIMMKQRYGRIINMSSVVGLRGNIGQANYAASKAGLIGMTKSFAQEYAKRNVTVNAIAPGFIETPMTDALSDIAKDTNLGAIPMARMGTAKDIAQSVDFLASDAAGYITGVVLSVDGGMGM